MNKIVIVAKRIWKAAVIISILIPLLSINISNILSSTSGGGAKGHLIYDQYERLYYCVGSPLNCAFYIKNRTIYFYMVRFNVKIKEK